MLWKEVASKAPPNNDRDFYSPGSVQIAVFAVVVPAEGVVQVLREAKTVLPTGNAYADAVGLAELRVLAGIARPHAEHVAVAQAGFDAADGEQGHGVDGGVFGRRDHLVHGCGVGVAAHEQRG